MDSENFAEKRNSSKFGKTIGTQTYSKNKTDSSDQTVVQVGKKRKREHDVQDEVAAKVAKIEVGDVASQTGWLVPVKPKTKISSDVFFYEARKQKHKGDACSDIFEKMMAYLLATLAYIQQADSIDCSTSSKNQAIRYKLLTDTLNLCKDVHRAYLDARQNSDDKKWTIMTVISLHLQSYLRLRIYEVHRDGASRAKATLDVVCTGSGCPETSEVVGATKTYASGMQHLIKCEELRERADYLAASHQDFFLNLFLSFGELCPNMAPIRFILCARETLRSLQALHKT